MFGPLAEKLKKARQSMEAAEEVTFKPYEEEKVAVEEKYEEPKKPAASMIANSGDTDTNIEFKIVRPASFEEVSTVADYLLAGCTVLLNIELLDTPSTLRMLDFLNGVTYSTDGDIKNVSKSTYIITPHNVDVSDDR